jgi:hypothetical protein
MIVTIKFYTLQKVGTKIEISQKFYICKPMEFTQKWN